ncbi:MAG: flagellar biosynthetic protein FliO [Candidatus Acidiferrum sp.]
MHSSQSASLSRAPDSWFSRVFAALHELLRSVRVRRRERSLRVCESLPLGEKRFLAVVQFEGRRFLIGATNQSISLLDRLDSLAPQRQKRDPSAKSSFLDGVH